MKAIIDRVEGNIAVMLFGKEATEVDFPLRLLPAGVKEGDWFDVQIKPDPAGKAAKESELSGLLDRLKRKGRSSRS